jgi:hypothetical protein
MDAPKQIKKRVLRIFWSCGAPTCSTQHSSEAIANRCPNRSKAITAERGHCLKCGQQFNRDIGV